MIAEALIREYLLTQSSVVALLGTNADGSIYASPDLPEHYDAAKGPCIQLYRKGGHLHPEILELDEPILDFRVWADQQKYLLALQVCAAIRLVLHGVKETSLGEGTLMSAVEALGPVSLTDPDTSWVMIDSSYQVMARPN